MSEQLTLPAEARERAGKGASRALRRDGRVPAVIYGDKKDPAVGPCRGEAPRQDAVDRPLHELGGDDRCRRQAAPHAAQGRSSSTRCRAGRSTSISCASASTAQVTVAIPVRFDNEEDSPGLKRGGVLNVVQHELELVCDAAEIPDEIHIDLDRPRHRQFDPHQPGQAAQGRQAGDRRPRLHRRHHRRPVGDEVRGRRDRDRGGRRSDRRRRRRAEGEADGESDAAEGEADEG